MVAYRSHRAKKPGTAPWDENAPHSAAGGASRSSTSRARSGWARRHDIAGWQSRPAGRPPVRGMAARHVAMLDAGACAVRFPAPPGPNCKARASAPTPRFPGGGAFRLGQSARRLASSSRPAIYMGHRPRVAHRSIRVITAAPTSTIAGPTTLSKAELPEIFASMAQRAHAARARAAQFRLRRSSTLCSSIPEIVGRAGSRKYATSSHSALMWTAQQCRHRACVPPDLF
jgi:hypothetical protein